MRIYFRGSTTKDAVSYVCGEEMRFELELVGDGKTVAVPLFKWECTGDDGAKSSGFVPGESGKLTITTSVATPGFVRVIVYACALDGTPLAGFDKFEGGAGAEIDNIGQGIAEPDDYDEFWAGQTALLDQVEPKLISKKEIDSGNPDYIAYDVVIAAPGERNATAILTMPKNAAPGSLAARIGFHGYGAFEASSVCMPGTAVLWVNTHGIENRREPEYYEEFKKSHPGFGFHNNATPEECYFRDVILRDIQAARWLATIPEYDGKGLTVVGGSMGAMQATNTAAHLDNAILLDINVPWLCDLGGIEVGRLRGWRPNIEPGILYYDTVNAAKRVKCPVKITCGLGDYVCPPSGEVVLWHNFKTEKSIRFIQNQTHPYRPLEIIAYER